MTTMSAPEEPILSEPQRFVMFPIKHPDLWDHYLHQLASFWTPKEIDFSKDRDQWQNALNDDERKFLKCVLAFFAASDSVVSLNLMNNFCQDVKVLEAQTVYTFQAMMENIHAEVYSTMIDVYVTDPDERNDMFVNLGSFPGVREKVDWAERWSLNDKNTPFAKRLAAYVIVEGLFFSGAFCAIYWFKQRNLLPGLTKSNEFIARDEGQHTEFGCAMYNKLTFTRLETAEMHALFREAVEIESHFINEAIPCRLIGMNSTLMMQYIEYVADRLLLRLGYDAIYGSTNPFPFMDLLGMIGRSNFFEERVSLYQRADVLSSDAQGEEAADAYATHGGDF
jgi:ribonucleotide reductase beta subunit family protein with ferritin-like domain